MPFVKCHYNAIYDYVFAKPPRLSFEVKLSSYVKNPTTETTTTTTTITNKPFPGYGGGIFSEDPYLHLNKRELLGGALLLGAGVAKGIVLTGLFNRLSPNIQIGRKK
jgi:hypothetical protein